MRIKRVQVRQEGECCLSQDSTRSFICSLYLPNASYNIIAMKWGIIIRRIWSAGDLTISITLPIRAARGVTHTNAVSLDA